jgi:hypothetical protein
MQATMTYHTKVENVDYLHFYMTSWNRIHLQIIHSSYLMKCNMKLYVSMVDDTIIICHKNKLLD